MAFSRHFRELHTMRSALHLVAAAIRRRELVHDAEFDQVYPSRVQQVSSRFWTPVEVAIAAARWLNAFDAEHVLDVGAGAGKFCIVTSLALARRISGIEQREHLVETARAAASAYGARIDVTHATIESVDPACFDAFYLYNPFGENLYGRSEQLDATVELSEGRCLRDLAMVEGWLDAAPSGTKLVTYHGFGGRIPASYRLERSAPLGTDLLRLWRKRRAGRAREFFVEVDEVVLSSDRLEALCERIECAESRSRVRELLNRPLR